MGGGAEAEGAREDGPAAPMTTCTFDREKHAYAIDGEPAFSVTQALRLAGLEDDYSRVPPAIRMKAAQRGTYVHEATDLLDQGRLDWDWLRAECAPLVPYTEAYQACREREPFQPDGPRIIDDTPTYEDRLWWKPLSLAGQLDRRGTWDGTACIVDVKTSKVLTWTIGVQLALYTILWLLREGVAMGKAMTDAFPAIDRRVIQLGTAGPVRVPMASNPSVTAECRCMGCTQRLGYHVERYQDRDDLVLACAAIHIARKKWTLPATRKALLADAAETNGGG